MLKKNDVIQSRVVDVTNEGFGVVKVDNFPIFVPFTCLNELVEVIVVKVQKTFAFGRVKEILEPSPDRIEPSCGVYNRCGGCSLRHMSYEAECDIKENYALETMKRVGKVDLDKIDVLPIHPSLKTSGYRNKAQYPIQRDSKGNLKIGFYASRTHDVIDGSSCDLQPSFFKDIVELTREFINEFDISVYDEIAHKGLLRHLYIRYGEVSGQIMVCLVLNGKKLPYKEEYIDRLISLNPNIKSIVLDFNTKSTNVILGDEYEVIYGSEVIIDTLCGNEIEISPLSFYQVNHDQAEVLYGVAKEFADLKGNELLIDLYCGAGTIGLSMANDVDRVIGVEIIEEAIEAAKRNATRNGYTNTEFYAGDASKLASDLAKRNLKPEVIVVDPPRKGITQDVIDACVTMNPSRVVYVSCNVATLARDVELFSKVGYEITKFTTVDLFPRTSHVEAVALLERVGE